MSTSVRAVLFAKHLTAVATFYQEVFKVRASQSSATHVVLNFGGFELMVQQIPPHLASDGTLDSPPQRRKRAAIRLNFPLDDIVRARREAARLGGLIDDEPPPWASAEKLFYLGYDSEGNVFGVSPAS
jgi:predicted enzyme related to lactoylglutathione lyase